MPPQILEHAPTKPTRRRGTRARGRGHGTAADAGDDRGAASEHAAEPSLEDREPKFYAPPQPALPPKDMVEPPPEFYQPPGRDA